MRRKNPKPISQQKQNKQNQDHEKNQPQFISYSNYLKKKQQSEMNILKKMDYNHIEMSVKKKDSELFRFLRNKGNQHHGKKNPGKEEDFDVGNQDNAVNQVVFKNTMASSCTKWGNKSTQDTFFNTNDTKKFGNETMLSKFNYKNKNGKNRSQQTDKNNNFLSQKTPTGLHLKQNPTQLLPGQKSSTKNHLPSKPRQQYNQIDPNAIIIKGRLIYLKQDNTQKIHSKNHLLYLLQQNNISYKQYLSGNREQILKKIINNQNTKQNQIIKDYILRNMNQQNNGEILIMDRFHEIKNSLFD